MAFPAKKATVKGNPFAKGKAAAKVPAKKPGMSGDAPKKAGNPFAKKKK